MKAVIVTNGDIKNLLQLKHILTAADWIICADGAAKYLMAIDIVPHILLGDLDSIDGEALNWMTDRGVEPVRFPARKDATDTELAVDYAMALSPEKITIVGGVGSRWDHSLSNILLLKKLLNHGISGWIVNENNEITIIDSSLELEGKKGDIVSIIPISAIVKGVNLYGLEYPLVDRTIPMGSSLGISNCFKDTKAKISLTEGILLVIKSKEE